jgi:guanylate kinase
VSEVFPGLLFVMVGPAGAGKNTVMKGAIRALPGLRQLPTATTRAARANEQEGREHLFISEEQFHTLREQGRLLEHQVVHGNWYGIARDPLESAMRAGEMLIADIDMYGAQAARAAFPRNTVLVFVAPPSIPLLTSRMNERGESDVQIARRMLRVGQELAFAPECDDVIVNDSLEHATQLLLDIIARETRLQSARMAVVGLSQLVYIVRTLVVYGDEVATATAELLPEQGFDPSGFPHVIALENVRPLGLVPPVTTLTTYRPNEEFIPPVLIEIETVEGVERCIYYYVVRLGERAPLAQGWRWQPSDTLELEEPLRQVLGDLVID